MRQRKQQRRVVGILVGGLLQIGRCIGILRQPVIRHANQRVKSQCRRASQVAPLSSRILNSGIAPLEVATFKESKAQVQAKPGHIWLQSHGFAVVRDRRFVVFLVSFEQAKMHERARDQRDEPWRWRATRLQPARIGPVARKRTLPAVPAAGPPPEPALPGQGMRHRPRRVRGRYSSIKYLLTPIPSQQSLDGSRSVAYCSGARFTRCLV